MSNIKENDLATWHILSKKRNKLKQNEKTNWNKVRNKILKNYKLKQYEQSKLKQNKENNLKKKLEKIQLK